ncbi:hypothetical protein [Oscillatoria acuminata]|uniref:hypothetical protein n=1 Tax=Oscillatoria acuminata TaxID=118323 RepID=UPI0018DBFAE3|nr:hypothetical protein [Oscillatoria acuminata]
MTGTPSNPGLNSKPVFSSSATVIGLAFALIKYLQANLSDLLGLFLLLQKSFMMPTPENHQGLRGYKGLISVLSARGIAEIKPEEWGMIRYELLI